MKRRCRQCDRVLKRREGEKPYLFARRMFCNRRCGGAFSARRIPGIQGDYLLWLECKCGKIIRGDRAMCLSCRVAPPKFCRTCGERLPSGAGTRTTFCDRECMASSPVRPSDATRGLDIVKPGDTRDSSRQKACERCGRTFRVRFPSQLKKRRLCSECANKQTIVMIHGVEMTAHEIAVMLGIGKTAVQYRIRRGLSLIMPKHQGQGTSPS